MRILNIFNHYLERGGEAQAVEAIGESLSHILHLEHCEFFSSDWTGSAAPATWKQALWMIRNPRSLHKLRDYQQSFTSNAWLVHNVLPVGSVAIYAEAKRLGVPVIQYVHNFRPFSVNGYLWAADHLASGGLSKNYWEEVRAGAWQNSRGKTAWLALVLLLSHALGWWRGVKAWIAISDFMKEKFIFAGVPAERIFTLRHFWKPTANGPPNQGRHYLYLGRLIGAKGIMVLLKAWERLEQRFGGRAPRLIVGGAGPLENWVAAKVTELRTVTFAGQLSGEAKRLALSGARALIAPSLWWEALGLVAYEAYDYSKPVLAARSGGLSETVFHQRTGLLHEPGNAEQLADQIAELDANDERRWQMGREGRLWLEANTNEEEWRGKFLKIVAYATGAM